MRRERDASDRRARPLSLSDRGLEVYAAIVPAALAYERRLLNALTDGERKMLVTLLDKLEAVSRPEP